jgi:hypothetical protein
VKDDGTMAGFRWLNGKAKDEKGKEWSWGVGSSPMALEDEGEVRPWKRVFGCCSTSLARSSVAR